MARRIWTSRSPFLDHQRCSRLRYLGYHAGSQRRGLQPVKKSIHLVLGGAVHAGLEVLLREGQARLNDWADEQKRDPQIPNSIDMQLDAMFLTSSKWSHDGRSVARQAEDAAVLAALAELAVMTAQGVELDDLEKTATAEAAQTQITGSGIAGGGAGDSKIDTGSGGGGGSTAGGFDDWDPKTGQFRQALGDSALAPALTEPILEITFGEPAPALVPAVAATASVMPAVATTPEAITHQLEASLAVLASANSVSEVDWSKPVYLAEGKQAEQAAALAEVTLDTRLAANAMAASGLDGYLREELAAQVEAMVRAYSRRRWRGVLAEFEVLEVEREGEWKLGEVQLGQHQISRKCIHGSGFDTEIDYCVNCGVQANQRAFGEPCTQTSELWFASRADALLRERATGYLYIMSYKTTGSWDRRKAADAEVDMQGLSEAVDIEKRLAEAWLYLKDIRDMEGTLALATAQNEKFTWERITKSENRVMELVNSQTMAWLRSFPEPPRILGVRYEYLLKGPRRQDKHDPQFPGRYVADTPLIRAYKFDGLTADDRRWAASFTYYSLAGKSSRLDYRAWKKAPVWRYMTIAQWVDMLDAGEIQPDIYDENGHAVDVLAEQFVPAVVCYRNDDDMRDMLQQLEAEETRIAVNVAAVQAVEEDAAKFRSELNVRFPQNRKSCSWPGACDFRSVCFGSQVMRENPESSELYQVREANYPQEDRGAGLFQDDSTQAKVDNSSA